MSEFFKWLSNNPIAALTFIVSFGILLVSVSLIYLIAFLQGREVSFWPPKLGANPKKAPITPDNMTEIEILDMKKTFPQHIAQRTKEAQKYILDTNLNEESLYPEFTYPQEEYRKIRDERVIKGQIAFKRVEVIFNKEQLEYVIRKLLRFEGYQFYLRHYDPPPQAIPVLHIMSFDGEHFYLGGFYPSEAATEERAIYIRNKQTNELLQEYWQMLWLRAKPLNEGTMIKWEELQQIGKRVGVVGEEFDKMVNKIKEEKT